MRALHVEDDDFVAELYRKGLKAHGIVVDRVSHADDAEAALLVVDYEAIILDLSLPDVDGLTFLRALRRRRNMVPVIIISARSAVADKVEALTIGADDFVSKPIQLTELAARLFALKRRPPLLHEGELRIGNLALLPQARLATVGGEQLQLSRRESLLLALLMGNLGRPLTREAIGDRLYGFGEEIASNAVEVLVFRLRSRLRAAGADVKINSARGVGYTIQSIEPKPKART
ncbi:MAG: DNA-binding response regulator [Hyphomicrobiales bacterium]|nr:DNA-binding response regulator [Hyphomicrobiales bacterium]